MAITSKARSDLRVRVSSHGDEAAYASDVTPTGLIRTSNGLVIPPSTLGGGTDTKTGALADLTDTERMSLGIEAEEEEVEAPPAPAPVNLAKGQNKRNKRKRTPEPAPEQPKPPRLTRVTLTGIPGLGDVPTQYLQFLEGTGCLVIGLDRFSYVPVLATLVDGELRGTLSFAEVPGKRYAFLGNRFSMDDTEFLILIEVPNGGVA